ncbi:MAG: hypothetical protein D6732_02235 [Methanobacteriota archaeon]|nr:MAG: hypothetical protein D6732_02235 [Euryarchaeota archaeon]
MCEKEYSLLEKLIFPDNFCLIMKRLGLLFIILLLVGVSPASAEILLDENIVIDTYYRSDLGNSTYPIMLWFLHNQSLDEPNLVMNAKVMVISATDEFSLNLIFEKKYVSKNNGSSSMFSLQFKMKIPLLNEGDTVELSFMWNRALNRSDLPSRFIPQPSQLHYFEDFAIQLEESGFWDNHVELEISLWTSFNSSKVNNLDPIYLNHSISRSENTMSLGSLLLSGIFIPVVILWRRLK